MSGDIVLTPQTVAVVGLLLSSMVAALGITTGAIVFLYRQFLRERDARMIDLWRDNERQEIRIATLEGQNERLQRLATDATEGWKLSTTERARMT
jgi:hypothetical protein